MKTLHYEISINASREKVWDTLTNKATYEEWTNVFSPGSTYEGDWSEGSQILFLGPGDNGTKSGMIAKIVESRQPEYISIKHIGMIENDIEDTTSEKVQAWAPAYENYTLEEIDGGTKCIVDMQSEEEMCEFFDQTWPQALQKLKEICER